jgi:hypothetical protein
MKYLRKYNENLVYKDPIDVELDVDNFIDMFKSKIGRYSWREETGEYYNMMSDLNSMKDNNPTMTDDWSVWGVYKINSSGRIVYSGYARAISKEHAKLKIAIYYKNIDIFTPKYNAEILSKEDIDGIIDSHEYEIFLIKNPI